MKLPATAVLAFVVALVASTGAHAQTTFSRPDCAPSESDPGAESRCIRAARNKVRDANFADLQQAGLMFRYMTRPDLKQHPDAKAAIEKKIEGSFTVRFDVAPDGTVYNVRAVDVTAGIEPLAKMWADTIGQWTFVKTGQAEADIEHRRIYLYAREDDAEAQKKPQATF
jgi:hypothetical protein